MPSINNLNELKEAILLLEVQQVKQRIELQEGFKEVYESVTPGKIFRNVVKELAAPDLQANLLNIAVGLATGFLTKKVFIGGSHNPLKKILGTVLELGITGIVARQPGEVLPKAMKWINNILTGIRDKK
jgi:hypothetical protein